MFGIAQKGDPTMSLFSRIGRLFKGFVGLFVSGLEESNPEALMEAARQEFRDKTAQYNVALARMAGVAERLKGQIKTKTSKAQELERRILANHRAGNMELAGSLARELQELKADLTHDAQELTDTEEAYQANMRQAKIVQKEFQEKIHALERQLSQVKIKEAQAEAAAMLGSVTFKVGDMGDTMKTVEEVLAKRYELSAGKARVAKDMVDVSRIQEKEGERKALEQEALADFLAMQGIQAAPPEKADESAAPAKKEIGPSEPLQQERQSS
jgi:phage shock protein A